MKKTQRTIKRTSVANFLNVFVNLVRGDVVFEDDDELCRMSKAPVSVSSGLTSITMKQPFLDMNLLPESDIIFRVARKMVG